MAVIQTGDNLKRLKDNERLGANRESEYLGAEDIDPGTEPILTINGIWNGMVTLQRGKENKDVITFAEKSVAGIKTVRPLIVNATNRKMLKKLYGSVQAKNLEGERIQLYIDHKVRDPQDGSLTDGIRIKNVKPKAANEPDIICEKCGQAIQPMNGMTAKKLSEYTKSKYGSKLCSTCAVATANSNTAKEVSEDTEQ